MGAAIGVGEGTEERAAAVIEAGADVIVVDTAHGHSKSVLHRVRWVKRHYPKTQVIGGNVATATGAKALVDHGADAVKVGIGPGSICTTRIVAGVGVPQITAVANVARRRSRKTDVPLIADGGIRYSGDIAKAIAAGAHVVMIGSLLRGDRGIAGRDGALTRGAPTSPTAAWARSRRDAAGLGRPLFPGDDEPDTDKLVPEGVEGRVPYKGQLGPLVQQLDGRPAREHGLPGLRAPIDEVRAKRRVRGDHRRRHPRVARARRADRQGSAELPRRVIE